VIHILTISFSGLRVRLAALFHFCAIRLLPVLPRARRPGGHRDPRVVPIVRESVWMRIGLRGVWMLAHPQAKEYNETDRWTIGTDGSIAPTDAGQNIGS